MKKTLLLALSMFAFASSFADIEKTITTNEASTLKSQLPMPEWGSVNTLTISGPLSDADLQFISNVAKATNNLVKLDLSATTGLTTIMPSAFSGIKSLSEIILPSSITKISDKAFMDCPVLSTINMPAQGVTDIEDRAFSGCTSLTSITLSASLKNIDPTVFLGCTSLQEIKVAPGSENYSSIYGILYTMEDQTLVFYPVNRGDEEFQIPDGTSKIGINAFADCKTLQNIEFPNSVKSIEKNAFINCEKLNNLIIGEGITSIGDYAFNNCQSLTSVSLPKSVKKLGDGVFIRCCNLTSIRCENPVPPTIRGGASAFFSQDASICSIKTDVCVLSMPKGSAVKYTADAEWGKFTNVEEFQVGK